MAQEPTEGATIEDAPASFYVNHARLHASGYDLLVYLGRSTPDRPDPVDVTLSMSWEHAKALAAILTSAVQQAEKEVGEFPNISVALEKMEEAK
jgi:hypothetical protein